MTTHDAAHAPEPLFLLGDSPTTPGILRAAKVAQLLAARMLVNVQEAGEEARPPKLLTVIVEDATGAFDGPKLEDSTVDANRGLVAIEGPGWSAYMYSPLGYELFLGDLERDGDHPAKADLERVSRSPREGLLTLLVAPKEDRYAVAKVGLLKTILSKGGEA